MGIKISYLDGFLFLEMKYFIVLDLVFKSFFLKGEKIKMLSFKSSEGFVYNVVYFGIFKLVLQVYNIIFGELNVSKISIYVEYFSASFFFKEIFFFLLVYLRG